MSVAMNVKNRLFKSALGATHGSTTLTTSASPSVNDVKRARHVSPLQEEMI